MKRTLFLTLTWIFAAAIFSNFFAQPVPEYEGVYLLTKSNELIELPQKNGIRARESMARSFMKGYNDLSSISTGNYWGKRKKNSNDWSEYDPKIVDNLGDFFYISKNSLNDIPVINIDDIKGFYINSKYGKYSRFNGMSVLKDYTAGYGIFYKFKDGTNPNSEEHIAYGNFSFSNDKFKVKNINEFVTYYKIDKKNELYKTRSAISSDIPCVGFYIELTVGNAWVINSYQYPFYVK